MQPRFKQRGFLFLLHDLWLKVETANQNKGLFDL